MADIVPEEQCAAMRPVSGGAAGIAFLKCYLPDDHKGLHLDTTEGVAWRATRLSGAGAVHQQYLAGERRG